MNLRSPSLIPHRLCRIRHQIPVSFHVTARTKSELELSVSESGNEELRSELSPVLDERSRRSLRCCVDGVSDSPYTSSSLRTDGQPNCSGSDCLQHSFPDSMNMRSSSPDTGGKFPPDDDSKPGRGLPSIDGLFVIFFGFMLYCFLFLLTVREKDKSCSHHSQRTETEYCIFPHIASTSHRQLECRRVCYFIQTIIE